MRAKELIGKQAIRIAPTCQGDYSYTTDPLLIVAVTDTHVLTRYPKDSRWGRILDNNEINVLNITWVDDNWTDYEKLMQKADPIQVLLDEMEEYFNGVYSELEKRILEA